MCWHPCRAAAGTRRRLLSAPRIPSRPSQSLPASRQGRTSGVYPRSAPRGVKTRSKTDLADPASHCRQKYTIWPRQYTRCPFLSLSGSHAWDSGFRPTRIKTRSRNFRASKRQISVSTTNTHPTQSTATSLFALGAHRRADHRLTPQSDNARNR